MNDHASNAYPRPNAHKHCHCCVPMSDRVRRTRRSFRVFLHWVEDLAKTGWSDVLSIGTSHLTQSHFGEQWGNLPNGGGIPINSEELSALFGSRARPTLVRTYAGTTRMLRLAELYERNVNIAWHALSLSVVLPN